MRLLARSPATSRSVVQAKTWAPTSERRRRLLRREPAERPPPCRACCGLDAEDAEGGKDSEEEGRSDGEKNGEAEDGEVDGDGMRCGGWRARRIRRSLWTAKKARATPRAPPVKREEEDFGEGVLQEVGGRGSEGRADGGFAVATDEAGELRVCEIDAGDEQGR